MLGSISLNYLTEKFAIDLNIAECGAAILRYMQQSNIPSLQYADDLVAKSCKVTDAYGESILNDIFIELIDASIHDILRHHWTQNSQADLIHKNFSGELLLSIEKGYVCNGNEPESLPA